MFHLPLFRTGIPRFVSVALALIVLTISATLLSYRSGAASSPFNNKPNYPRLAGQQISATARTKPGLLSRIFGGSATAAMPTSTTFTVNTTDDHDDGSCDSLDCTLREAINATNSNPGADTIDFVVDRSTVKVGRYMPGVHLRIDPPERLLDEMPDYLLLLAWNLADEIMAQQGEYRRRGGRFIVPVPVPEVVR